MKPYAKRSRGPQGEIRDADKHVGARIRARRTLLGISQIVFGQIIGVTFQQVQKYEAGDNRVSASRLYDIAKALNVAVAFFFEGLPETSDGRAVDLDPMAETTAIQLVTKFNKLSARQQLAVEEIIGAIQSRE